AQWLTIAKNAMCGADVCRARGSHSTIMTILVDHGVVGVLIFWPFAMWIFGRALERSDHMPTQFRIYKAIVLAMLGVTFVSGFFTNYLKAEVQVWSVAILTSLYAIEARVKANVRQTPTPLGATPVGLAHP